MSAAKKSILSTKFLKEVYRSKTCFLFVDKERVALASPVATGIINAYNMNFWDQVKKTEEDIEELLSKLIIHLESVGKSCNLTETEDIFVLSFSDKSPD